MQSISALCVPLVPASEVVEGLQVGESFEQLTWEEGAGEWEGQVRGKSM